MTKKKKKKKDPLKIKLDLMEFAMRTLFEGNADETVRWFLHHNRALDESPLRAMEEGREEEVRNLIGRLEHGVFI